MSDNDEKRKMPHKLEISFDFQREHEYESIGLDLVKQIIHIGDYMDVYIQRRAYLEGQVEHRIHKILKNHATWYDFDDIEEDKLSTEEKIDFEIIKFIESTLDFFKELDDEYRLPETYR